MLTALLQLQEDLQQRIEGNCEITFSVESRHVRVTARWHLRDGGDASLDQVYSGLIIPQSEVDVLDHFVELANRSYTELKADGKIPGKPVRRIRSRLKTKLIEDLNIHHHDIVTGNCDRCYDSFFVQIKFGDEVFRWSLPNSILEGESGLEQSFCLMIKNIMHRHEIPPNDTRPVIN